MTYLEELKAQRSHAASRASHIAERIVMEGRHKDRDALDTMHTWSHLRDALDQQIGWMERRTGWAWPKEPAWTD